VYRRVFFLLGPVDDRFGADDGADAFFIIYMYRFIVQSLMTGALKG